MPMAGASAISELGSERPDRIERTRHKRRHKTHESKLCSAPLSAQRVKRFKAGLKYLLASLMQIVPSEVPAGAAGGMAALNPWCGLTSTILLGHRLSSPSLGTWQLWRIAAIAILAK